MTSTKTTLTKALLLAPMLALALSACKKSEQQTPAPAGTAPSTTQPAPPTTGAPGTSPAPTPMPTPTPPSTPAPSSPGSGAAPGGGTMSQ